LRKQRLPELTFGVLGRLTCLVQADFLTLDLTCITCHVACLTQWAAQITIVFHQRAGQTKTDRTGLT